MKHSSIAIIGAGSVGTTTAYTLMLKNIVPEILLIDIDKERCLGEVKDLADALPYTQISAIKAATFKQARTANIIIITAGQRQKKGQRRSELLNANATIILDIIKKLLPIPKDTIVIMVTNPVDTLAHLFYAKTKHPSSHVLGSGTLLESRRLCKFIASKLKVGERSIDVLMLGEHGESQFVAWSTATIDGTPLKKFSGVTEAVLQSWEKQAKKEVYEIIERKGATYFGVASCIAKLCESIVYNQQLILPASCYVKEFDTYINMPALISEDGIKKIIKPILQKDEQKKLHAAAQILKDRYHSLKL